MTPLGWLILLLAVVPVVWLWAYAIGDVLRRDDVTTLRRSVWIAGIIVVPLVGSLLYLVYRPTRPEDLRGFGRSAPRRRSHPTTPDDDTT